MLFSVSLTFRIEKVVHGTVTPSSPRACSHSAALLRHPFEHSIRRWYVTARTNPSRRHRAGSEYGARGFGGAWVAASQAPAQTNVSRPDCRDSLLFVLDQTNMHVLCFQNALFRCDSARGCGARCGRLVCISILHIHRLTPDFLCSAQRTPRC